jgi:hypothetical protein
MPHQHAQLADEVAFPDDKDHPVVPAVQQKHAAGEDKVQVVGITGVPQQLARLGMQHLTGRPQQVQSVLAEHRPGQRIDIVVPLGGVIGLLVGHGQAAHASPSPGKRTPRLPARAGSRPRTPVFAQ